MYDNARGYAGSTYIAIGYQLQWGKGKTFSIPFPAQCLHVVATYASTKSADDNSDITVTATSTTGYITHKTYETFFLALGHQPQWGYGNSESTQTFPVKYPNAVIGIYGSKRAINYEYTFAATSITNSNFFMSTRNAEGNSRVIGCNWMAIGQQQTR